MPHKGMMGAMNWNVSEIHLKDFLPHMPDSPICPILVKFFLQVPDLAVIPPTFFQQMPVLEVLDLSNTNIVSLPASISSLSLLREFYLRDCTALIELPTQIGMLSKLKLFDIKGTELMFIPKEMGKLKELEVLRVSLSQYAKNYIKTSPNETVIPRKMISELKRLKELCVIISVGLEPEWWEEEVKYIQQELCYLENLKTLRWYLPTSEALQQFLLLERNHVPLYAHLSNLMLTIGQHAQLTSCLPHDLQIKFEEFKNCLKWINAEGSMDDISKIMASADALFLSHHWTIENLSTFNVTKLKYCLLVECNEMETLVEANDGDKFGFELLQYLSIHYMSKLQSIWKGPIGKDSLSKLRILALHTCLQLTSLFTPIIAQNLSCLVELTVEDCPKVINLISGESHNVIYGPIFPSLEKIFLLDLPELVNIFVGQIMLENLKTMLIYSCLQLRNLSNMKLPKIKKIEGEIEWWKGLGYEKLRWVNMFVPLKKGRDLIEQLFEAKNSLQHLNDAQLQGYDEKKSSNFTDKGKEIFFPPEGHWTLGVMKPKLPETLKSTMKEITEAMPSNIQPSYSKGELDNLPISLEVHDEVKRINIHEKKLKGTLVLMNNHSIYTLADELLGSKVSLQLISANSSESTVEGSGLAGKLGKETHLNLGGTLITPSIYSTFEIEFNWEDDIGVPGAFLIINRHHKEFYLQTLTLTNVPNVGRLHFICNSWVYPENYYNKPYRVFFLNQTYLPGETPEGLRQYREEELEELRGDGTGTRKEWDRVYDYDVYNDLSQPDKGSELVRPIFGGCVDRPYPRRCRTGRPLSNTDSNMETRIGIMRSLQIYVPKDEGFSELKMSDLHAYGLKLKSVSQDLLPGFESLWDKISDKIVSTLENVLDHKFEAVSENILNEFSSFGDVLKLYEEGLTIPEFSLLESAMELLHSDAEHVSKFPVPQAIQEDKSAWTTDEEFGRELLAGICPVVIRRLEEFPPTSKLDPIKFGNQNSSMTADHIVDQIGGFSVCEAMENNRLFILDHHDPLMPYLRSINETPTKTYATRTILFLQNNGTLKPIAIELSLPHPDGDEAGVISTVHTPASHGAKATLWLLAKTYAKVNNSGYHQLVCHWLHTHASIEPFIIATHRQLSVLHPIHKLLHPHFLDTLNINALSRQIFINAGGLLENTVFPNKYSLDMSSNMYKKWVFPYQALPVDLLYRGMAVPDPSSPHGLRLLIDDYPFAVDGLEIWSAIESWVHDYVSIYYHNDEQIKQDNELQSWWWEVRNVGHGDLKDEPWWPRMHTREELIQSCTIIIWVASALHAALNFGQYPYGGYLPNWPTMSRKLLPEPGTPDYDELEADPEQVFLKTVTPQLRSILGISLFEVLSRHSADEIYLGERDTPEWTADKQALEAFDKFGANLRMIEKKIEERNHDKRLRNRTGPAQMPYTLLYPSSEIGLTGRGIPNSISI